MKKKPEEAKDHIISDAQMEQFKKVMETAAGNVELALEDMYYTKVKGEGAFAEIDNDLTRKALVERSKLYFNRYPIYKQAVALDKGFILGKGVSRPISKNPYIQYMIDYIWDARENKRTFTGYKAMENIIAQKDLSGEVFFMIYINEMTGENVVRIERDTDKITDIITQPGDKDSIQFYIYETVYIHYDYKTKKKKNIKKKFYIPDIYNEDEELIKKQGIFNAKTKVRMYGFLVSFGNDAEASGLRGYPIYRQTLPWFKAHKEVAEDVATILKAKSRFAWEKKFPQGISSPVVQTMMNAAKSLSSDGDLNKTTPAVGDTLYTNSKYVENKPIKTDHDAKAFEVTSKILMQEVASGTSKNEHYFGNPSDANLATATAMELPMQKIFEAMQKVFADELIEPVLKFLILKILAIRGIADIKSSTVNAGYDLPADNKKQLQDFTKQLDNLTWENLDVTLYMPDIIGKETAAMISAITTSINSDVIDERIGSTIIYAMLGVQNIDDIIAEQYGDYDPEQKEKIKTETELVIKNMQDQINGLKGIKPNGEE